MHPGNEESAGYPHFEGFSYAAKDEKGLSVVNLPELLTESDLLASL